jgi:hypothetical protein
LWTLVDTCGHFQQLLEPFSSLQDEDFRPASEVFGKGGMDLDYLNQVKLASRSGKLHSGRRLKRISFCNDDILSVSAKMIAIKDHASAMKSDLNRVGEQ